MRGNITRRGKSSWRLKFDSEADAISGKRRIRYVTVRGKRQEAERELARLLNDMNNGTLIEPSKLTVAEHIRAWLEGATGLSPKTAERYRQLTEQQIIPHLGNIPLQKLRPAQVAAWHSTILKRGGEDGRRCPPGLSAMLTVCCAVGCKSPSRLKRCRATSQVRSGRPR